MADLLERLERELQGEPVQVGDASLTPVARVTARRLGVGGAQGRAGLLQTSIDPTGVVVRAADGHETRLELAPAQKGALAAIAGIGAAAMGLCAVVCLVARRR